MAASIEAPSADRAVMAAQQFRLQMPGLLKTILTRYQVVGARLALFEESVREIPHADVRFRLFALDAHLTLSVRDDDLTMVSELATDVCEEIDSRLGPTYSQLKIKRNIMDIHYDRIAPRPDPAVADR